METLKLAKTNLDEFGKLSHSVRNQKMEAIQANPLTANHNY